MSHSLITNCPVCNQTLSVIKLHCKHCHTTIENDFALSKFNLLTKEQLQFIETFLVCRGNIKEVEKELGISYPTVRSRLNEIVSILGYETKGKEVVSESKIIEKLEQGEISPDDAISLLKK